MLVRSELFMYLPLNLIVFTKGMLERPLALGKVVVRPMSARQRSNSKANLILDAIPEVSLLRIMEALPIDAAYNNVCIV
jgi:hypothetical protein